MFTQEGGILLQFSPETATKRYDRQFLSLKNAKLHKMFLLAPLGRSLVSQVVLRRCCGQKSRRLRMRHIYELTKTKFSHAALQVHEQVTRLTVP